MFKMSDMRDHFVARAIAALVTFVVCAVLPASALAGKEHCRKITFDGVAGTLSQDVVGFQVARPDATTINSSDPTVQVLANESAIDFMKRIVEDWCTEDGTVCPTFTTPPTSFCANSLGLPSCKLKLKLSPKDGVDVGTKKKYIEICCFEQPDCKTKLGTSDPTEIPITVQAQVNAGPECPLDASLPLAGEAQCTVNLDPIGVIQLATPGAGGCRSDLATAARAYVNAALQSYEDCHRERDLAGGASSCLTVADVDLTGKIAASAAKLESIALSCATLGSPANSGYAECPAPCAAFSTAICSAGTTGAACTSDRGCDSAPGALDGRCGDWGAVGGCLSCLLANAVEAAAQTTLGDPPVVPLSAAALQCHLEMMQSFERTALTRIGEAFSCQKKVDGGKLARPTGGDNCTTIDLKGLVASSETTATNNIAQGCANPHISEIDACAATTVADYQSCLLAESSALSSAVAGAIFPELRPRDPGGCPTNAKLLVAGGAVGGNNAAWLANAGCSCDVTFSVTNNESLANLQFSTNYSGANGEFNGSGSSVICTNLVGNLATFNDNELSSTLDAGISSLADFTGPIDVAKCAFTSSTLTPPTPGSFPTTITDQSDAGGQPTSATVGVTDVQCSCGAGTCVDNGDCIPGDCLNGVCVNPSEFDYGSTGFGHDQDIADKTSLNFDVLCAASGAPCGICTIFAPATNDDNCRCQNDFSLRCDEPFGPDSNDCGGGLCECYVGPPQPIGVGGAPACLLHRLTGPVTGILDVDTSNATIPVNERMFVYLGISATQPCPTCTAGVCSGGARNGLSCGGALVHGSFGPMSLDCPPSLATNISGAGLRIVTSLTAGPVNLPATLPCDAPFAGSNCPCAVCSLDPSVACHSDADCAAASAGLCNSTGGGAARAPNSCLDLVCSPLGGGSGGQCNAGPVDKYCDGATYADGDGLLPCTSNSDCVAYGPGTGNCTLSENRRCFLDPITDAGYSAVSTNRLVGATCVPPTGASSANSALGLPGAAHIAMVTRPILACGDGVTQYVPGVGGCP